MINLNRKRTSRIIWETLLENVVSHPKAPWVEQLNMLDALRATAKSPTGSVSFATFWCLYAVVQAYKPKRVAEVGTYIGKSTLALVSGGAEVHTCDYSNDVKLPFKVNQYPMTSSTDMFAKLQPAIDLLFLDGRLEKEDLSHIGRLLHSQSVVALDDFEGIEKGVANAMKFTYQGAMLVYPPERELLERHGIPDESTLALILPHGLVQLTNQ
jgi:predicted O-methyltransferase YrrM